MNKRDGKDGVSDDDNNHRRSVSRTGVDRQQANVRNRSCNTILDTKDGGLTITRECAGIM